MDLLQILSLVVVTIFALALLTAWITRFWLKYTSAEFKSNVNLTGKTVLITGANSGIGKETARYMAKNGARVIMACRTMSTAKKARDEIAAESENSKVILQHLDLSSFQSVREFAKTIIETEPRIDILIHNAGYGGVLGRSVSVDGLEYTMATNHYGPFLLTYLLMDVLRKSTPCRIVVVSSKAHTIATFDPRKEKDLNPIGFLFPMGVYSNSKVANLLFTFELARRLKGTGITANALHPGTVDTEIWPRKTIFLRFFTSIGRVFMRTLDEGIQTILHVSLSTQLDGVTGQYFRNCRIGTTSRKAQNTKFQRILWEESERIVKLTTEDPMINSIEVQ